MPPHDATRHNEAHQTLPPLSLEAVRSNTRTTNYTTINPICTLDWTTFRARWPPPEVRSIQNHVAPSITNHVVLSVQKVETPTHVMSACPLANYRRLNVTHKHPNISHASPQGSRPTWGSQQYQDHVNKSTIDRVTAPACRRRPSASVAAPTHPSPLQRIRQGQDPGRPTTVKRQLKLSNKPR